MLRLPRGPRAARLGVLDLPLRRPDLQRARRRDLHAGPVPPRARLGALRQGERRLGAGLDGDRRPRRRDRKPFHAERRVLVRGAAHARRARPAQRPAPDVERTTEGRTTTDTTGLSDPDLTALFRVWASPFRPGLGQRAWVSVVAGVKTPWGRNDLSENGVRLDEHAQPGTGATDVYGGLSAVFQIDPFSSALRLVPVPPYRDERLRLSLRPDDDREPRVREEARRGRRRGRRGELAARRAGRRGRTTATATRTRAATSSTSRRASSSTSAAASSAASASRSRS